MTKDLTEIFRAAFLSKRPWTEADATRVLEALRDRWPGSRIDWEPGDEEWGRVFHERDGVVGMVCARAPIGAARARDEPDELPDGVAWLRFESTTDASYSLDRRVLEPIFTRVSDVVDYAALSLDDLWYATV